MEKLERILMRVSLGGMSAVLAGAAWAIAPAVYETCSKSNSNPESSPYAVATVLVGAVVAFAPLIGLAAYRSLSNRD